MKSSAYSDFFGDGNNAQVTGASPRSWITQFRRSSRTSKWLCAMSTRLERAGFTAVHISRAARPTPQGPLAAYLCFFDSMLVSELLIYQDQHGWPSNYDMVSWLNGRSPPPPFLLANQVWQSIVHSEDFELEKEQEVGVSIY